MAHTVKLRRSSQCRLSGARPEVPTRPATDAHDPELTLRGFHAIVCRKQRAAPRDLPLVCSLCVPMVVYCI